MPSGTSNFLINPYNDPVVVVVKGKASFHNSAPLKDVLDRLIQSGSERFVLDFKDCTGMDSTFLGILAGLAIQLRKKSKHCRVILFRLGERNLELVKNLGLHRILAVDTSSSELAGEGDFETLPGKDQTQSEIENARMVLQAHENLIEIDPSNQTKFQDVIDFLKSQMDEE